MPNMSLISSHTKGKDEVTVSFSITTKQERDMAQSSQSN